MLPCMRAVRIIGYRCIERALHKLLGSAKRLEENLINAMRRRSTKLSLDRKPRALLASSRRASEKSAIICSSGLKHRCGRRSRANEVAMIAISSTTLMLPRAMP